MAAALSASKTRKVHELHALRFLKLIFVTQHLDIGNKMDKMQFEN